MKKSDRDFIQILMTAMFFTLGIILLLGYYSLDYAVGFYMFGCISNFIIHMIFRSRLKTHQIIFGSLLGPVLMFIHIQFMLRFWENKKWKKNWRKQ